MLELMCAAHYLELPILVRLCSFIISRNLHRVRRFGAEVPDELVEIILRRCNYEGLFHAEAILSHAKKRRKLNLRKLWLREASRLAEVNIFRFLLRKHETRFGTNLRDEANTHKPTQTISRLQLMSNLKPLQNQCLPLGRAEEWWSLAQPVGVADDEVEAAKAMCARKLVQKASRKQLSRIELDISTLVKDSTKRHGISQALAVAGSSLREFSIRGLGSVQTGKLYDLLCKMPNLAVIDGSHAELHPEQLAEILAAARAHVHNDFNGSGARDAEQDAKAKVIAVVDVSRCGCTLSSIRKIVGALLKLEGKRGAVAVANAANESAKFALRRAAGRARHMTERMSSASTFGIIGSAQGRASRPSPRPPTSAKISFSPRASKAKAKEVVHNSEETKGRKRPTKLAGLGDDGTYEKGGHTSNHEVRCFTRFVSFVLSSYHFKCLLAALIDFPHFSSRIVDRCPNFFTARYPAQ